jgi:hypothetical protein
LWRLNTSASSRLILRKHSSYSPPSRSTRDLVNDYPSIFAIQVNISLFNGISNPYSGTYSVGHPRIKVLCYPSLWIHFRPCFVVFTVSLCYISRFYVSNYPPKKIATLFLLATPVPKNSGTSSTVRPAPTNKAHPQLAVSH